MRLEMYEMVQKNVETPFAAVETLRVLKTLRRL